MNNHVFDNDDISSFFESIAVQRDAYAPSFSFIARRCDENFILSQAAISLNTGPSEVPNTRFKSENLRAGNYLLSELSLSIEGMLSQIVAGSIDTPDGKLLFPKMINRNYDIKYEAFHRHGIQNQSRLSVLRLNGAPQVLTSETPSLDWELRGSNTPYDNVQELMNEYKLGLLRTDNISVEFIAFNVVAVEFASKIEGSDAYPQMRLANGLDSKRATLGYRVIMRGAIIKRGLLTGRKLKWSKGQAYQIGIGKLDIPANAALQCFASYAGIAQHFGWLADPLSSQNPRRAVYEAFDVELKVLKDIFEKAHGRGSQTKDFEAAIAWLLWMLGFSVAHLGGIPRTQDAADLVAVAPNGSMAIVECTTGLLKAENKMAILNDRVQAAKRKLASFDNSNVRILPVMVTSKSKQEVKADLEQAEKLGILIMTKEDLEPAILRTLLFHDADKIIDEGFRNVHEAEAKYLNSE